MSREECVNTITDVFRNVLNVPDNMLSEANFDLPLTGEIFQLNSMNLVYLFFEIEKRLNIHIDGSKLLNYEFNTINGIIEVIQSAQQANIVV